MTSRFLLGSYSDRITEWQFNEKTREITPLFSYGLPFPNPTWIAKSHNRSDLIFAVHEIDNYSGGCGAISSFLISPSGNFTHINTISSSGVSPCHICVDRTDKFLIVSNYHSGTFTKVLISPSGELAHESVFGSAVVFNGDTKFNRDGPHAHNVEYHRGIFYGVDLGCNFIFQFPTSADGTGLPLLPGLKRGVQQDGEGSLQVSNLLGVKLPDGSGPRHIKFHPTLPIALVLNEDANTLTLLSTGNSKSQEEQGSLSLWANQPQPAKAFRPVAAAFLATIGIFLWYYKISFIRLVVVLVAVPLGLKQSPDMVMELLMSFLFNQPIHMPTSLSTLRAGEEDKNNDVTMNAAELIISKDGRFVYVSNRDIRPEDQRSVDRSSVAVFRIHTNLPDSTTRTDSPSTSGGGVTGAGPQTFSSLSATTNVDRVVGAERQESDDEDSGYVFVSPNSCDDIAAQVSTSTGAETSDDATAISPMPSPSKGSSHVSPTAARDLAVWLELVQHVSSGGNHPRHFCLLENSETPSSILMVANQRSDNIVTYLVDSNSGRIDETSRVVTSHPDIVAPAVVCFL